MDENIAICLLGIIFGSILLIFGLLCLKYGWPIPYDKKSQRYKNKAKDISVFGMSENTLYINQKIIASVSAIIGAIFILISLFVIIKIILKAIFH